MSTWNLGSHWVDEDMGLRSLGQRWYFRKSQEVLRALLPSSIPPFPLFPLPFTFAHLFYPFPVLSVTQSGGHRHIQNHELTTREVALEET